MYEITTHTSGVVYTDRQVVVMHAIADRGLVPNPSHFWYVEGQDMNVLVDTGGPPIETTREHLGGTEYVPEQPFVGGKEQVRQALDEHGVVPEDIDIIICTHLHTDHNWNVDLFPNATLYVQRDELTHALDPTPHQRFAYSRESTLKVAQRSPPNEIRIMDGDYTVAEGIDVYKTPGHTPGHQCAVIQTKKGKVGLYLSKTYQNWFPADPDFGAPKKYLQDTFCIEGILTESSRTYLETMERMSEVCDVIVPVHEPYIPRRLPEQWYFTDLTQPKPSDEEKAVYEEVKDEIEASVLQRDD